MQTINFNPPVKSAQMTLTKTGDTPSASFQTLHFSNPIDLDPGSPNGPWNVGCETTGKAKIISVTLEDCTPSGLKTT